MDQIQSKCLWFDRFTLNLARGTLRVGDDEIALRPKTFDVLRHLAENAGRLVLKQDFHETVWPDVAVTDDSLVQCIRELRQILGDEDHSLIKTVSRRGYLLDAEPRTAPATGYRFADMAPPHPIEAEDAREFGVGGAAPRPTRAWKRNAVVIATAVLCVALGAVLLSARTTQYPVPLDFRPAPVPPSALNKYFTESDAKRVAEIAQRKQLPLPKIEFDTVGDDVPAAIRRFVGIWVSDKGFVNTNRQFMFLVTHVEKQGLAGGWTVRGPPAPNSRIQNPAEAVPLTAFISDDALTYTNPRGDYRVWFADQRGLVFRQTYVTGDMTMVALDPLWTLIDAETATAATAHR
jgi:DNA-binding winged helix-turn-helix (wHTH) protein